MSIIVLTGKNEFAVNEKLANMIKQHTNSYGADSVLSLSGNEIDWQQLSQSLSGVSLFEPNERMIIVRFISENKSIHEDLQTWCKQHADSDDMWPRLIVVDTAIDRRSNLFKTLKKTAEIYDMKALEEGELVRFLVQEAKRLGGSIDAPVARHLIERSGGSQQQLVSQLDVLVTYEPKVSMKSIDELILPSLKETIFQLLDFVSAGNHAKALELYSRMREHQTEAHYIMTMIAWQSSNMALVKAAGSRSDEQIAKRAKLSPFVIRKTRGTTKRLSVTEMRKWLDTVAAADLAIKQTSTDIDQVVQTLIAHLCAIAKK